MRLSVVGVPVPQGSKTAHPFHRKDGSIGVAVHEGGRATALKDWRQAIAEAFRRTSTAAFGPFDGPLVLGATFYLPKPKSAKKNAAPAKKPDCSKLIRAVEDALSKVAYRDDSQIVKLVVEKRYAVDRAPGVEIDLLPL